MGSNRVRFKLAAGVTLLVLAAGAPGAQAFHFYRGPGGGCTPTDGAISDDAAGTVQNVTATVHMLHNGFADAATGLPVTRVHVGESIRWEWNSSHCHSVEEGMGPPAPANQVFASGFHYPTAPPESPQVQPGFFEYPVLDLTPTLTFTHTFTTPGTYNYYCVHHAIIGMRAVVVVS